MLTPIDTVQDRFLRSLGITSTEALFCFRLAPLSTRRDMAILGMVHRTVLGKGPPEFAHFFQLDRSVCTPRTPRRHE
eukprot:2637446-Alexandrium_andersonii.AAC.1